MKNFLPFLCVAGGLTIASSFLGGCGGGGGSNGSGRRPTNATLTFSNATVTAPVSVKEATTANADSRNFTVGGDSTGGGQGVHTGFDNTDFHIFAIDESNENFRDFEFYTPYEGSVINPEVGSQVDFATDDVDFNYFEDAGQWTAISGTGTIISNAGNSVTLRLDNVVFTATGSGATGAFTINGRITYNENDTVDEREIVIDSLAKSHKGAVAAKKLGTSSTKKSFKW